MFYPKCNCLLGSWNSDKSLIQVFATLFLLSFITFLGIFNNALAVGFVLNISNQVVAIIPLIDPTVSLFSRMYLPLVILSAIILVFFLLPPILVLLLFPTVCFMKVSTYLKPRWVLGLKIFTDTFYGSYKDGTNGTSDFRKVAGSIFLIWVIQAIIYTILSFVLTHNMAFTMQSVPLTVFTALSIVCLMFQPYKHRAANISGTILPIIFIIAGGMYNIVDVYKFSTEIVLLCIAVATLPHCVFYGYGIYRLAKWLKQCTTTVHGEEGILCRLLRNRNDQLLMNPTGCPSRV